MYSDSRAGGAEDDSGTLGPTPLPDSDNGPSLSLSLSLSAGRQYASSCFSRLCGISRDGQSRSSSSDSVSRTIPWSSSIAVEYSALVVPLL